MNATYTIRYETTAVAALEVIVERARELTAAAKPALMLVAAPLIGLAFVIALPIAGLALAVWMLTKTLVRKRAAVAAVVKRIALFFIAPFVALVYVVTFPFAAAGMLVYWGIRAARN